MNARLPRSITIAGAGPAGSLMAILLARRNVPVQVFERRADLRRQPLSAGRSINLALAERGIHALRGAGVYDAVQPLLTPMLGRMLHDQNGDAHFVRYGQRDNERIYSISRLGLNGVLLDAAKHQDISLHFENECIGVDFATRRITVRDESTQESALHGFDALIGADGVGSMVRQALSDNYATHATAGTLPHGYKELTLPCGSDGRHQIEPHALHIWPRGGFMLIALPNIDGSFTVTLFLPFVGPESFESLRDAAVIQDFFSRHFPDALGLMPHLADEFLANPTGKMVTIRTRGWTDGARTLLIGDAAHAVVPFHGQGMNCAFEDCVELDTLLGTLGFDAACREFERRRRPNTDAIAAMALENYIEMRDTVRDPKFLLQKELSFELERRFPEHFIPRYSMVMFHHEIPYAEAYERGRVQAEILTELTREAVALPEVDMQRAAALVETRLPPLSIAS